MVTLNLLPDVVLLRICDFLNSCDLLNLSETCVRFYEFCNLRQVVSRLDFSSSSGRLSSSMIDTFFKPRLRCANIFELNLNYCHWLSATALYKLEKLTNLKELHILDCAVSNNQLVKIIKKTHLCSLSFTWKLILYMKELEKLFSGDFGDHVLSLKSVTLLLDSIEYNFEIGYFLALCRNLESLVIFSTWFSPLSSLYTSIKKEKILFDKLCKIRIQQQQLIGLMDVEDLFCIYSTSSPHDWDEIWFQESGCPILSNWIKENKIAVEDIQNLNALSLSGYSTKRDLPHNTMSCQSFALYVLQHKLICTKLCLNLLLLNPDILHAVAKLGSQLRVLEMRLCESNYSIVEGFTDLCVACWRITHLDLSRTHSHEENENPCEAIANLKELRMLKISACWVFYCPKIFPQVDYGENYMQGLKKSKRIGLQTDVKRLDIEKCKLWILAKNCSNLTHLEIVGASDNSRCGEIGDDSLFCISNWSQLCCLKLAMLRTLRGECILDIMQKCKKLRHLHLISVQFYNDPFHKNFINGLNFAKCLKNVCAIVNLNYTEFCETIQHCKHLAELFLSALKADKSVLFLLASTLCMLPNLNAVHIHVEETNANRLRHHLKGCKKENPELKYYIRVENDDKSAFMIYIESPVWNDECYYF